MFDICNPQECPIFSNDSAGFVFCNDPVRNPDEDMLDNLETMENTFQKESVTKAISVQEYIQKKNETSAKIQLTFTFVHECQVCVRVHICGSKQQQI